MAPISEIRAANSTLKSTLPRDLVAIFIGGTSGIGLSTARELVRNTQTQSPHIYIVGRSSSAASQITTEFKTLNPSAQTTFIQSDVSLLKNVDDVCRQIKEKESKVNLLFLTPGYFTVNGKKDPTAEGLDRKMALHYYARARFISNLAPLLKEAAEWKAGELSRVVSVLDAKMGRSAVPDFEDLSLKKPGAYGLKSCAAHATAMNSWAMEYWAAKQPETSFVHAYPSGVKTGVGREMGKFMNAGYNVLSKLMKPLFVDLGESGERHLFAATYEKFVPRGKGGSGDEVNGVKEGVAVGSDEVVGSGSYALDWNSQVLGRSENVVRLRGEGAVEKVWRHTEEVFKKVMEEGKY